VSIQRQQTTFMRRVSQAIKLRKAVFEEVEADTTSLKQAIVVVTLSAVAMALGGHGSAGLGDIAVSVIAGILGWVLWSWLAFAIGTTVLRTPETTADLGQLLRTTGFATAPGLLAIVGALYPFAGVAVFVASIWMLAAFVVAVRQALDYVSTLRALVVCLFGWGVYTVMLLLLL
jgi:Yip1 domain